MKRLNKSSTDFENFCVPTAIPLPLPDPQEAGAFHGVPISDMSTMTELKRNLLSG